MSAPTEVSAALFASHARSAAVSQPQEYGYLEHIKTSDLRALAPETIFDYRFDRPGYGDRMHVRGWITSGPRGGRRHHVERTPEPPLTDSRAFAGGNAEGF